jgi:hypothetical protein
VENDEELSCRGRAARQQRGFGLTAGEPSYFLLAVLLVAFPLVEPGGLTRIAARARKVVTRPVGRRRGVDRSAGEPTPG